MVPDLNFLIFSTCYGVLRFVMENGAKGCEVIVSGKLRAQRAKSMKFKDGISRRNQGNLFILGMVNKERLGKMKKKAILINCSREPITDGAALVDHLRCHSPP
ncbi:glycerate dehydrogenase HPR, peroxisomal-like [Salvia miltiorrhiza]|uniref:glycerate dehydrogenase HPR, peroxisomal-like n=1 Tax=Salvia miltiorrhiza TaxID=226208 RepID=UPI0025AB7E5C|nr:glycerate dehydrogenase HPR, peroxisomal-like [Salvia miltiorrhiza]